MSENSRNSKKAKEEKEAWIPLCKVIQSSIMEIFVTIARERIKIGGMLARFLKKRGYLRRCTLFSTMFHGRSKKVPVFCFSELLSKLDLHLIGWYVLFSTNHNCNTKFHNTTSNKLMVRYCEKSYFYKHN